MFQRKTTLYTLEEYLALEEEAESKSEYYQGEIFAMASGSVNHNQIMSNVNAVLNFALETKTCRVFSSDMRLLVKASGLYTYPDVMVACDPLEFTPGRTDTITNPLVLIEVLSKSTREYDRGKKFEFYQTIETFQDYLLIDQERVRLEYFHKLKDGRWILTIFNNPDVKLTIDSIGVELPITRIYHKVDWFAI